MLLEGIFLPLTTPFHANGRLFEHKLALNVEHYSRTQAAGMLVLGGVGEPDSLTDEETRAVLSTVAVAAAREKVLLAGVGRGSVYATLELAEFAASAGYDAIAVRPPEVDCNEMLDAELMTYFQAVADRSALPVVVLAEPERPLRMDVIGALAQHPNIFGAIDNAASRGRCEKLYEMASGVSRDVTVTSTFNAVTRRMLVAEQTPGNMVSAESLGGGVALSVAAKAGAIKTRAKRVGFQYLAGSAREMLVPLQAGAVGAAPRLGAAAPQACCEVWQAFKDGDEALAAMKQDRIREIGTRVEGRAGLPMLKYACDLNAYFGGRARLPLLPCSAEVRAMVEREMGGLKN